MPLLAGRRPSARALAPGCGAARDLSFLSRRHYESWVTLVRIAKGRHASRHPPELRPAQATCSA